MSLKSMFKGLCALVIKADETLNRMDYPKDMVERRKAERLAELDADFDKPAEPKNG